MEIMLAIVVTAAVIFFGALLSMGNERQRMAIDELRDQVVLWAEQDLRIKRTGLAKDVKVNDPVRWLNEASRKVVGENLDLQIVESFDEPQAILCQATHSDTMIIFSPASPKEVGRQMTGGNGKLDSLSSHPLQHLSPRWVVHAMSVLNSGILFDIELALAWQALTGREIGGTNRLYLYMQRGSG
jgi:hypothetical protein